ncbi:MAG: hypothetical protein ABSG86_06385 [Thermoguttaceae bacterium]|jgi:hypothetical protein
MDNLVRAHENQLFVQLSYTDLNVNDKDVSIAQATGGQLSFTRSNTTDLTKAAPLQMTRAAMFAGAFPFAANSTGDRTLSFKATPVTDQNYVYEEYLAFAKNSDLFMASPQPPTCHCHVSRKCGDKWYWVTDAGASAFMQLVLRTAFGPDQPSTGLWSTTIDKVEGGPVVDTYKITLSKDKLVPNDDGLMVVRPTRGGLTDRRFAFNARPDYTVPEKGAGPTPQGGPTMTLYFQANLQSLGLNPGDLFGADVQFFSNHYPSIKPSNSDTQKIVDGLDNIRVLLNKTSANSP